MQLRPRSLLMLKSKPEILCPNTHSFQTGDPSRQHFHSSILFCFPQPGAPSQHPRPWHSSQPFQVSLALLCCPLLGWPQCFLVPTPKVKDPVRIWTQPPRLTSYSPLLLLSPSAPHWHRLCSLPPVTLCCWLGSSMFPLPSWPSGEDSLELLSEVTHSAPWS